jgi:radical SAM superfamily enzyme YgiQ (UPF0313 family)
MTSQSRPDLVLINPGDRAANYQSLGDSLAAIENPIWGGLLASFARRRGFSVEILDANAEGIDPETVAERIEELDPILTAVIVYGHNPSASTAVVPIAGETVRTIKRRSPEQQVLMIGGHVSALPEQTLREEGPDYVSTGEGFYTITELIECLKQGAKSELRRVSGLLFEADGALHKTSMPKLVNDLDFEVPGHSWDLLPMDTYRAHNWHCFGHPDERQPYAAIYTTLGCPFRCEYCCIQAPFKTGEQALGFRSNANSYRRWNADTVMRQIDTLVQTYGVRNIKIADEMFALDKRHVYGICDQIVERGYDLNIWAYARVDTVDMEFLEKMRAGGVRWLCLGIESGSERVRNDVNKSFKPEKLLETMKNIESVGIHVNANYIFGLPEDDMDSMRETYDLAVDLNCEFANFYSAMAYPGSALYRTAKKKGWSLPDSWASYAQLSVKTKPLSTRHITGEQVLEFRDTAFDDYFARPEYLEMLYKKFGAETVVHVRQMASESLERDCLLYPRPPLESVPAG